MGYIPKKTLEDLEFFTVTEQLSSFAITPLGKIACQKIVPLPDQLALLTELNCVSEFLASFENDNRIPNHGFEDLSPSFQLLKIENSVLEISSFRNIASASDTINTLLLFFKKLKTYYPSLSAWGENIEVNKEIKLEVDNVIDRFGEIRDNASDILFMLRKQIQTVKGKISQSFNKALSHFQGLDYLDDIRESVMENKRVLAVKAMHRRKVKGGILGSSKTGSIVYIEPEATLKLTRELQNLLFEETEEIKKILSQLTDYFRPHLDLIKTYQQYLIQIDTFYARARYAKEINALLPIFTKDQELWATMH